MSGVAVYGKGPAGEAVDMNDVAERKVQEWLRRMRPEKPPDGMDTDAPGTSAREQGV